VKQAMCSVTCTQQAAHPFCCSLYYFFSVWESELVHMCTLLLTTTSAPLFCNNWCVRSLVPHHLLQPRGMATQMWSRSCFPVGQT